MTRSPRSNGLIPFLGSVKLTIALLAIFGVAVAVATFIETAYSTAGARALVYNALWFELILALLVVNLLISLITGFPYRAAKIGFVITHISFIVVLLGAGVTRWFGFEGVMSIREGERSSTMLSDRDHIHLVTGEGNASFPVRLWKPGVNSLSRKVEVAGEKFRVSVKEYWPHYAEELRKVPGGSPILHYDLAEGKSRHGRMEPGEQIATGGFTVRFDDTAPADELVISSAGSQFGEIVVRLDGEEAGTAVRPGEESSVRLGDLEVRILEFYPDFRVGSEPDYSAPMSNPAIQVGIKGPNGASEERYLFALHPEFNMGHTGEPTFADLDIRYAYGRTLYLSMNAEGQLTGVADFQVTLSSGAEGDGERDQPSGESFLVPDGTMLQGAGGAFTVSAFWQSAKLVPSQGTEDHMPSAVRIEVQDGNGNKGEAIVKRWTGTTPVRLGDREVSVAYQPVQIRLPYEIYLDDFKLVTYPGSQNPASFESHVRVYDPERGVDGKPSRIYMNHPLTYRGYKHFQSSYDQDRRGTVLSVNHDPGKWPTYAGYTLMTIGFLVTLTRGLVWNRAPKVSKGR